MFGTPNSGLHGQHVLMNPSFHGPTLLSGGTDGPEGSVLVLLSEALIVVLVAIIYRPPRFPLICDFSDLVRLYQALPGLVDNQVVWR